MLVVLADKNPYDLQALQAGLCAPGRELLILADGENIVTLCQARRPDVIIAGSSLGQMGGLAVSRDLKMLAEQGVLTAPKIILMLERAADSWLADWSRCDAYVVKPIDPPDIDRLIDRLCGLPAA